MISAVSILRPIIFRYDLSPGSVPNPSMNIRTFNERTEAGTQIKDHYFAGTVVDASTEELLRVCTNIYYALTKNLQHDFSILK